MGVRVHRSIILNRILIKNVSLEDVGANGGGGDVETVLESDYG